MEDILASIRRIINEDEPPPAALARPEPVPPVPPAETVLELVEPLPPSTVAAAALSGVEATLEGLVREMLKPMLRDWLDTNLPDLVRAEVASEIGRISRRD